MHLLFIPLNILWLPEQSCSDSSTWSRFSYVLYPYEKIKTVSTFNLFSNNVLIVIFFNFVVRPKMIVIPNVRTLYQIAGGNTTIIKVIIAGGVPMPQVIV